jgi:hypothetical protein
MIVTKRPPQLPLDNSFVPTWKNVAAYFSRYLGWVASDPSFMLSDQVGAVDGCQVDGYTRELGERTEMVTAPACMLGLAAPVAQQL